LARAGYSQKTAGEITGELERLVGSPPARSTDDAAFAEFCRIRREALAFLDDGKAGMAVLFLERAIEMNPEFFTLQSLLADAYLRIGKRREAIQATPAISSPTRWLATGGRSSGASRCWPRRGNSRPLKKAHLPRRGEPLPYAHTVLS